MKESGIVSPSQRDYFALTKLAQGDKLNIHVWPGMWRKERFGRGLKGKLDMHLYFYYEAVVVHVQTPLGAEHDRVTVKVGGPQSKRRATLVRYSLAPKHREVWFVDKDQYPIGDVKIVDLNLARRRKIEATPK